MMHMALLCLPVPFPVSSADGKLGGGGGVLISKMSRRGWNSKEAPSRQLGVSRPPAASGMCVKEEGVKSGPLFTGS